MEGYVSLTEAIRASSQDPLPLSSGDQGQQGRPSPLLSAWFPRLPPSLPCPPAGEEPGEVWPYKWLYVYGVIFTGANLTTLGCKGGWD